MPTVTPPRIVTNVNAEVNSNTIVGISNEGNTDESYTIYQACPYSREGDDVGSVNSVELYDSMLGRGGRIKFTIPFNPQPLPRPRFYKKGIANTKKSYMEDVRNILEKNKPEFCPVDKSIPLSVSITLFLKRPLWITSRVAPGILSSLSL